jgi:hypothetical protein
MPYLPNSLEVARRSPQNGINIAGTPPPPQLNFHSSNPTSTTAPWAKIPSSLKNTLTVNCAKRSCGNMVTVVPFGYQHGEYVHIKVECKDCYVPIVLDLPKRRESRKEGASKGEDEWA